MKSRPQTKTANRVRPDEHTDSLSFLSVCRTVSPVITFIAGSHPQSPRHFAWQPSPLVSRNLRSSYLSHVIAAAT